MVIVGLVCAAVVAIVLLAAKDTLQSVIGTIVAA